MLCIHCGAINSKENEICIKCGKEIFRQPKNEILETNKIEQENANVNKKNPENIYLDQLFQTNINENYRKKKFGLGRYSKSITMMVFLIISIAPLYFMRIYMNKIDMGKFQNLPQTSIVKTPNPIPKIDNLPDTKNKVRAMEIRTALRLYYSQTNYYPVELEELYPEILNTKPEDFFDYSADGNPPQSFTLQFTLENQTDTGANMVDENGIKKYSLTSEE